MSCCFDALIRDAGFVIRGNRTCPSRLRDGIR